MFVAFRIHFLIERTGARRSDNECAPYPINFHSYVVADAKSQYLKKFPGEDNPRRFSDSNYLLR